MPLFHLEASDHVVEADRMDVEGGFTVLRRVVLVVGRPREVVVCRVPIGERVVALDGDVTGPTPPR